MGSTETSLKVLMFPWLAQGHISPSLELAKRLIKRNIYIYFCSTPINLASIKSRIDEKQSLLIQLVELNLPALPELPPHHHTTNGLPQHLNSTLHKALRMAKPEFSEILKTLKPELLIYDVLMPWAKTVASLHNIPATSFLIANAAICSFFIHKVLCPDDEYPFPAMFLRDYEVDKVNRNFQDVENNTKDENGKKDPSPLTSGDFFLLKSFREIDGKYIDHLSSIIKRKIVPVGPLAPEPVYDVSDVELIEWLDKKDDFSTVFVSFGSEYYLSREEMKEIAEGLELSHVNFIWVIRFPVGEKTAVEEALPEGFIGRVNEKGVIIEGWAPQAKILSHSSIGGFVSHCGWNSVLESMAFGVPIIAVPMHLDQPMNARLAVEVGVSMEVLRGSDGVLHGEEVAKVIRETIFGENGKEVRRKSRELSESIKLRKDEEIDGVVEALVELCGKNAVE